MAADLQLAPVRTADTRILKRWSISAQPRGLVIGGGRLYVGLADRQSVAAIDLKTGALIRETVLDSEEIAATKEVATLRFDPLQNRLIAANGSDESVTILSAADLEVLREITLEGEAVRDAIPDPAGRFLYILGRAVHVWDADGKREITSMGSPDPMAIAVSADGSLFAVVGSEDFQSGKATVAVLYDGRTLREIARHPLQTDRTVQAALFAADGQSLVVVARDWIAEKPLRVKEKTMTAMAPRMSVDFGDLVNSEKICLADKSGPQILTPGQTSAIVHYVERRCGDAGAFNGSARRVSWSSIYGASAWAVAYDRGTDSIWATDPAGFVTQYRVPANEDSTPVSRR